MATTFIHDGDIHDHTAAADIASGDVVVWGANNIVGVALADIANGAVGAIQTTGVWRFTSTAHGLSVGDPVLITIATQVLGSGVPLGSVDAVVDANTIDVAINRTVHAVAP